MFSTKRLRFREVRTEDVQEIMKNWNNYNIRRNLGQVLFPTSKEQEEEWVKETWSDAKKGSAFTFAIEIKKTKELIGTISLFKINKVSRHAELGIAIYSSKHHGKGYGTEAMKFILQYGFQVLNLETIHLGVCEFNKPARHVYEKVGFKKQGRKRNFVFREGKSYDLLLYDITKKEWSELNQEVISEF